MAAPHQRLAPKVRKELRGLAPRLRLFLAISNALPTYALGALRLRLLRIAGLRIGEGSGIGGVLHVAGDARPASQLTIGSRCFVNDGCRFDATAPITIGDGVYFGHEVAVLTATHDLGGPGQRAGHLRGRAITIGDGAWLGARVTVLPGVTVGAGSVVAAGAIVTRSVPPQTLVGGVPAKPIRRLDDEAPPARWRARPVRG